MAVSACRSVVRRAVIGGLDRRAAVAVDAVFAVLVLAGLVAVYHHPGLTHVGPPGAAVRLAGTAGAVCAIPVRRLYPRWALLAATLSAGLSTALGGPPQLSFCVAVTAYSAATAGTLERWWTPPAAASLVVAAGVWIGQDPNWLAALIASVAVVCVGWFAGQAARERRNRMIASAERRAEQARQQAAALRQAAMDERLVIARELHDVVAHAMSVIAVRSGVARVLMDTDPGGVTEALGIIETTTRQALQEMRLLVGVLRRGDQIDADLVPAPGLADIATLVEQTRRAGVEIQLQVQGTPRQLPAGIDLSAYRITQEALTNVVRHAGPTHATLRIDYQAGELMIEVTDSGPLTETGARTRENRPGPGHGLIGMAERVALFGGRLETGPHGPGFHVRALLRTDEAQ